MAIQYHRNTPPAEEDDQFKNQKTPEQEAVGLQQQTLSEELPETAQAQILFELGFGFFRYKAEQYVGLKNAFNTIADPRFAENILDFSHLDKFYSAQASLQITQKELGKKQAANQGFAQARFLFWKSEAITPDQQQRAERALKTATKIHAVVKKRETEIKFQTYADRFHLSSEEAAEIKTKFEELRKKDPKANLDDYLLAQTKAVCKKSGEKYDKKEEAKRLRAQQKQAVSENQTLIDAAKKVLNNEVLNPNQPLLSEQQIELKILAEAQNITTSPQAATIPTPTISAPVPTTVPAAPTQTPIISSSITLTTTQPTRLNFPARIRIIPQNLINFQTKVNTALNQVRNAIINRIPGVAVMRLKFNALKIGIAKAGLKLAAKFGLKQLAASAIPVIGNAAMLAYEVLNTLTGGLLGKGVKIVVICILGILIGVAFLPILVNFNSTTSHNTVDNPKIVEMTNTDGGWNLFEKNHLTFVKPTTYNLQLTTISWSQFSHDYLTPSKEYLSLDK